MNSKLKWNKRWVADLEWSRGTWLILNIPTRQDCIRSRTCPRLMEGLETTPHGKQTDDPWSIYNVLRIRKSLRLENVCIPTEMRASIKSLKSMNNVWMALDLEYGDPIIPCIIGGLRGQESAYNQFGELFTMWVGIYNNLDNVGGLESLLCCLTLSTLVHLFPGSDSVKCWLDYYERQG